MSGGLNLATINVLACASFAETSSSLSPNLLRDFLHRPGRPE
jgi:hypothetical protein